VKHTSGVELRNPEQHLVRDALDLLHGERVFVDLLAQVLFVVLEDQLDLGLFRNHLKEFGDVGVVEVAQQGDLADGGHRNAFLSAFGSDLLEGHDIAVLVVYGLVDHSLRSFTEFVCLDETGFHSVLVR